MDAVTIIPKNIKDKLLKYNIKIDEIITYGVSDLDVNDNFDENWLVAFKEKFVIVSLNHIEEYFLKDIERIDTLDLVMGGRVAIVVDGEMRIICRYTNSKKKEIGLFVNNIKKLKESSNKEKIIMDKENFDYYCPKCKLVYSDKNRKVCSKCFNKRSVFFRLLSYAKKYKIKVSIILIFMTLHVMFGTLVPYVNGQLFFDETLNKEGFLYGKIGLVVMIILLIDFLFILSNVVYGRINAFATGNIIYDIKQKLFESMQKLSMSFYTKKHTGSLMANVSSDTYSIQYFFHDGLPYLITNSLLLVVVLIVMLIKNPILTFIALIPAPIVVIVSVKFFPKLYKKFDVKFYSKSKLNSIINDVLNGFRVVKAFGKENKEITRFTYASGDLRDAELGLLKFLFTMFQIMNLLMMCSIFIIWGFGGWQVVIGKMKLGELITFIGYIGLMNGPLKFMSEFVEWWSESMNSAVRIFDIIDAVPNISEKPDPVIKKKFEGKIEIENLIFSYEPNKPVLQNISMDIQPGEIIGIVGRSGVGKSTIANLLMRLYDATEGKIKIDGVDIRDFSLESLHKNIGIVMQETFLFNGSIADNISYSNRSAAMSDILRAGKAAYAHEFILKLPYGYDTIIGTGGQSLSGGEKQRISIARTILHNPKILILDEATASVDTKTEIYIQNAVDRLIKNRTVISIAHRLSTLNNANKIFVIEDGKIIEFGTHNELIKKEGEFHSMYTKQKKALELKGVVDL